MRTKNKGSCCLDAEKDFFLHRVLMDYLILTSYRDRTSNKSLFIHQIRGGIPECTFKTSARQGHNKHIYLYT